MDSLGQLLQNTRESKDVSLREAATATRIKLSQLEDMENDDYSKVPAPMYAKGFLKIYAQFLGLDTGDVLERFADEQAGKKAAPPSLKPGKTRQSAGSLFRRKPKDEEQAVEADAEGPLTQTFLL